MRTIKGTSSNGKQQSKIKQVMTAPLRAMSKAKNFYLRNMEDLAGRVGQGGGSVGGPAASISTTLPRSFSGNSAKARSDEEDYRELVRAVSKRGGVDIFDLDPSQVGGYGSAANSSNSNKNVYGIGAVGRSQSVGLGKIGRIDENMACDEFEEDGLHARADLVYPRSRSHAVARSNVGFY